MKRVARTAAVLAALLFVPLGGRPSGAQMVPGDAPGAQTFQVPNSGVLVVAVAQATAGVEPRSTIVRYRVDGLPPKLAPVGSGSSQTDVAPEQLEHVVALLETAGVPAASIGIQRYRPFDPAGSPRGVFGVVSVTLSQPQTELLDRIGRALARGNGRMLDRLQEIADCPALRSNAAAAARERARTAAAAVARVDGVAVAGEEATYASPALGTAENIDAAHPSTFCSGDAVPEIDPIPQSRSAIGPPREAEEASRATVALRAANAAGDLAIAQADAPNAGAIRISDFMALDARWVAPPGVRTLRVGARAQLRIDTPAGWLVKVAAGSSADDPTAILPKTIARAQTWTDAFNGFPITGIRYTGDRTGLAGLWQTIQSNALRDNARITGVEAVAYVPDCDARFAEAAAAAAQRSNAQAAALARRLGVHIAKLVAVSVSLRADDVACRSLPPSTSALAGVTSPRAPSAYFDVSQSGVLSAAVTSVYALR